MTEKRIIEVREDFPILRQLVHGKPLTYLDNAATTQKPRTVIDALVKYYSEFNSNIHRGVHELSQRATGAYEDSREKMRLFVNARSETEIIFVRGATEAINLVAQSYGNSVLGAGDEVIISGMEHHANIVPWQLVCEARGARLRVIRLTERGELDLDHFESLLSPRTKLVSIVHASNAIGTVNPVKHVIARAHASGVPVLIDGAQAVAHFETDVRDLDCDFYVLSGHKLYGPTGIGVLYGKKELLERMPPYQGGGDMIRSVTFEKSVYNELPYKFEAGTPHIEGVIGLGAALDYLQGIGWPLIVEHERDLLQYALARLREVPGLRFIADPCERVGVLSFMLDDIHPHDIGTVLDQEGIAIRAGHHCAQPVLERFGVNATARASLALYNTRGEIDRLIDALLMVREVFT
ncbi:MAG: cysteine sulfinate desulfinase [Bdellovibrionales bacterium RIFOXYC1_FULL_54_43]|nr:MAG: cysteine sulfinate desulfinase [Bdellovibrionales bacterium RIFOXYC1_FULL_54_43]OFZ81643.1 MAG: cysteine sulfinate desulfinase [Bdellovibrionales bacterium RIFOXYD1_FULL_55_31]